MFSLIKQFEPMHPSQPSVLIDCDFMSNAPSITATDLILSNRKIRLEA